MSRHCCKLRDLIVQEASPIRFATGFVAVISRGVTIQGLASPPALVSHEPTSQCGSRHKHQYSRNQYAFLTWLINEVAAIMASDSDIWHKANVSHGMMESAIRRCWIVQQLHDSGPPGSSTITDIIPYILQVDLVRALTLQCMPTIASSLAWVVMRGSGQSTISSMAIALYGRESSLLLFDNNDLGFLKLLILLHEITTLAMLSESVVNPGQEDTMSLTSLSIDQEVRSSRKRISHALTSWQQCYFQFVPDEMRALYHFCRLYHSLPTLHRLPTEAREDRNHHKRNAPEERRHTRRAMCTHGLSHNLAEQESLQDPPGLTEAVDHAWHLYDAVRRASHSNTNRSSEDIFLPIITFLAALCIWKSIRGNRSGSNAYGSTRVLQLFRLELQDLPWEGCRAIGEYLDDLI